MLDFHDERAYHEVMQESAIKEYCLQAGIALLVLFGSSARGVERAGSDVDLAVKMKKGSAVSKLDLIYHLGVIAGDREVDLVVLSPDTDPVLLFEIFSNGKLLYEERSELFAEERLRACKLYYDTEKLRRLQSEFLKTFSEGKRHVA